MAIFTQGNNSCYFIHIPRTGGRYVSSLFESSQNVMCQHHRIHENRIEGIDVTHLHYPLYNKYFGVANIPHITVVRNPVNKFQSSIKNMNYMHRLDYNSYLKYDDKFSEFMQMELTTNSYHNNWFLPQYKFISPNTHVWKYEWGFGNRFKDWVFKKTKINISINNVSYDKFDLEVDSKKYYYQLEGKVKRNVRKFYKKDYKRFGYFL
jgi:hypothetical protein